MNKGAFLFNLDSEIRIPVNKVKVVYDLLTWFEELREESEDDYNKEDFYNEESGYSISEYFYYIIDTYEEFMNDEEDEEDEEDCGLL